MVTTRPSVASAGLLRWLRRHAGDAVFMVGALIAAWFIWPTSLGGCTTLTVVSGESMEPTYYSGDLVISRCSADYEVGDIVVYNPPNVGDARIIHRIIDGDQTQWQIQGDNNDFIDPWKIGPDRIIGKAVIRLPKVGLLGTLLVSPVTWMSLFAIAGALVLWPGRDTPGDGTDDPELASEPGVDVEENAEALATVPAPVMATTAAPAADRAVAPEGVVAPERAVIVAAGRGSATARGTPERLPAGMPAASVVKSVDEPPPRVRVPRQRSWRGYQPAHALARARAPEGGGP